MITYKYISSFNNHFPNCSWLALCWATRWLIILTLFPPRIYFNKEVFVRTAIVSFISIVLHYVCWGSERRYDRLQTAPGGGVNSSRVYGRKTKKQKGKMRWTTKACESKRLCRLYLFTPCGDNNDHPGFKGTTIHLNPGPPCKTHNPPQHPQPTSRQTAGKMGL